MKKVQITETALRDANQSLIATRLPFERFEPILETMDSVGYYSCEVWGGATFDVCLRFLREDPWERLRKIRAKMPNTKLQMLFRGQNMLGYKHYPDDVVEKFIQHSVKNGIDIIRIFDALNDTRNTKTAVEATLKAGAMASGTLSYTTSPVHTLEKNVQTVKEFVQMGVQSITIKDMAGIMGPQEAYDMVSAIKDACDLPVVVHTHSTAGLAFMTYMKAVEAGADVIDAAISPLSGGTSQPATETLIYALRQLGYELDLKDDKLLEMSDFFKTVRGEFIESGVLDPVSLTTDTNCLTYQVPGGMLSNLISQLKQLNAIDRLDEALLETPKVRADLGYPPLVTPTSQMVGSQAVMNVLAGERYKNVGKEIKAYCCGEYGTTPAPIDPEILKKILKDTPVHEGRFADTLEPAFEKTKAELGDKAKNDEDVLSYLAFPEVADGFFKDRAEGFPKKPEPVKKSETTTVTASVEGQYNLTVNGKSYQVGVSKGSGTAPVAPAASAAPVAATPVASGEGNPVPSPMPGNVFKIVATVGQSVNEGDTLLVLEAMKMEIEVNAPTAGTVKSIPVSVGNSVNTGDTLITIA
ncbi:MAG: pyruvate carboxylase subunit B [Eubacteriales bacterium]